MASNKINLNKRDLLHIIRQSGAFGLSELTYGDLTIKFSQPGEKKPLALRSRTKSSLSKEVQVEEPAHSQDAIDAELELELDGLNDPTGYWEKRERGELLSADEETDNN
jgi:hypothetical protein